MELTEPHKFDYVLVGGGLQACLVALALRHRRPESSIVLLERSDALAGNHTWSFHESDVPDACWPWLSQVPAHRWECYRVHFQGLSKAINLPYCSTSSRDFANTVEYALRDCPRSHNCRIALNASVRSVTADSATTGDGHVFYGRAVIDCRGRHAADSGSHSDCGFQKFLGAEIELEEDWPISTPTLMDSCVDQEDGFHFIYVLPFAPRRVLVEDTYFSDSPVLDLDASSRVIRAYIERMTSSRWNTLRLERGCLPMPFGRTTLRPEAIHSNSPICGGYAGGWFHAATGYSFPLAVRFADRIASVNPESARSAIEDLRRRFEFHFGFARFLNRLLFRLVRPQSRFQIFRRLYRSLPAQTLSRFYAHEFSSLDAVRMVVGLPPSGLTPRRFLQQFPGIQSAGAAA